MHELDNEIYHLWRPDLGGIVRRAIAQKCSVVIQSHLPLDPCNSADVRLEGKFLGLTGQHAQYLVENFDLDTARNYPPSPTCDYSFAVDMPLNGGGLSRIEYGGRAMIMDQELQKNNLPEFLLLRITAPTRIRHARRHERLDCPEDLFSMPGLMLIDREPTDRRRLLALLWHYYRQKTRPKPELVNISAGGVCLKTEDPRCHRFMGNEERYLFFFFTPAMGKQKVPTVLVGKKVGLFRSDAARRNGLRIQFLREMIWTNPDEELKWIDVENNGSQAIRKLMKAGNMARRLS